MSKKRLVFITVIILSLVIMGLYATYATDNTIGLSNEYDMTLNFDLASGMNKQIKIEPGKRKYFDIDLTNSYNQSVKYGITYELVGLTNLPEGVKITTSANSKNNAVDLVSPNSTATVSIIVENNSNQEINLIFSVVNGYEKGGELIVPNNKKLMATTTTGIDNSGANPPKLTDGLIPVMYDESISKWVKADTTSSTSQYAWYDYDNKKWANAISVENKDTFIGSYNQTNKSVSINNPIPTSYSGTFQYKAYGYVYKTLEMTFKTGASGGTVSFDYSATVDDTWDSFGGLEILLNGSRTFYGISDYNCESGDGIFNSNCSDNRTFSAQLEPNTKYNLILDYYNADTSGLNIEISNISLPSDLTENLSVSNGSCIDEVYKENDFYQCVNGWIGEGAPRFYSNYTINSEENFVLNSADSELAVGDSVIGKYMCSDGTTECSELYRVKEVNNNIITNVTSFIYTSELVTEARETLKYAKAGTVIPEDIILAYYVWIPRYKYKLFNAEKTSGVDSYNAKTTGIDIVFENGTSSTGTVSCQISSTGVETCNNAVNGNYYTHPAFTFGEDELTGFWIGKYEVSNANQPKILPGMESWISDTVSSHYTKIKNMQSSGNIYGLSTDTTIVDSHMLKNIEYGALAYLTHSDYGRCTNGSCNKLVNADFNPYNYSSTPTTGDLNLTTTDNVYGVYDVVSSYNEFVMGNMIYSDGQTMMSGWNRSWNAGFNGIVEYYDDTDFLLKADGIAYPDKKYYDVYPFAESSNYIGHLGDSTSEVNGRSTYYNISPDLPWIVRGPGGGTASVFDYFGECGYDRDIYIGTRAALVVY